MKLAAFTLLLACAGAAQACVPDRGMVIYYENEAKSRTNSASRRAMQAANLQRTRQCLPPYSDMEWDHIHGRMPGARAGATATAPSITQQRNAGSVPAGPQPPALVVNCDPAGCWDTRGNRLNNAAGGNFHRSDGKFCIRLGPNQVQCN